MKIGFQTIVWWPFRDYLKYILEVIAAAGYQGVEFKQNPEQLLPPFTIPQPTLGTEFKQSSELLPPIEQLRELMEEIRVKYELERFDLIGLSGGSLKSRMDFCKDFQPEYLYIEDWDEKVAKTAAEKGFTLAIHPHVFKPTNSLEIALERLKQDPKLKFIPDTAHLTVAGNDPVEAIRLFEKQIDRIASVHLKDWTADFGRSVHRYARGFVELGEGDGSVKLDEVLEALKKIGYKGWLIVEQDYTKTDPAISTFNCARWLAKRGLLPEPPAKPPERPLEVAERKPGLAAETPFLETAVSAGWQDIQSCYKSIARAFQELFGRAHCRYELLTFWTCSPAHDQIKLVAIKPERGYTHLVESVMNYRDPQTRNTILTGDTIDEQTIKHFDLNNPEHRKRFGSPKLLEFIKATKMLSIPVFNPWNPNHVRLVVNVLHNCDKLPINNEELFRLSVAIGYSTSYALDEVGSILATKVNTLAGKSGRVPDFAEGLVDLVKSAIDCEEVAIFLRIPGGGNLEPVSYKGKNWVTGEIVKWWRTHEKSLLEFLDKKERFIMPRDWWEAIGKSSGGDLTERRGCITAPFVRVDGVFLGFVCASAKKTSEQFREPKGFSDDDEAILEGIVQAAMPKFEMEKLLDAHQKAILCIAHTIHRPLIDVVSGITYLQTAYKDQLDKIVTKWLTYIRQTTEDAQVIGGGTSRVFRALVKGEDVRTGIVETIDPVEETQRLAKRMNLLEKGHPPEHPNPKKLYIIFENRTGPSKIRVDKETFLFVMYNLLDNAIKYSYKGRYIEVVYEREESDLCIKVKSYGPPIPIKPGEENLPFELFWRGEEQMGYDDRDAIYHPGLGVGLWVSRELVKASGGRLWLVPRVKKSARDEEEEQVEEELIDPHYSIFVVKFPLEKDWGTVIRGL